MTDKELSDRKMLAILWATELIKKQDVFEEAIIEMPDEKMKALHQAFINGDHKTGWQIINDVVVDWCLPTEDHLDHLEEKYQHEAISHGIELKGVKWH